MSIFALGGVNEIGKNMYAVQMGDDIVVIDCGSKFPDESLLGIDLIIPDIAYLLENTSKVRGLLVTHGHEDHIGAIPYVLKQLNMPIYATRLTLGLISAKLKEAGLAGDVKLHEIDASSEVQLGAMRATFFRTNHSIPDCVGIVFHTAQGVVVHTGDFKFDLTPVGGQYPDLHAMADIGKRGVLALLSESTNAERPGFTPSEQVVGEHIEEAFRKAEQKVFLSTFASNVNRLQQVVNAAAVTGRRLVLLGRSMVNVVHTARELGYLHIPEGMLVEPTEVNSLPPKRVAVLCTGSQGEPMAALARLSSMKYRQFEISPGDTVILSATPIPGNERSVSAIVDNLYRLGAKVIYGSGSVTGMHVSGHGSQEELKLMLSLMKPTYFVPIHGEYRMLRQHALLAEAVGVKPEHIFILKNGEVLDIEAGQAEQKRKVTAGNTLVDGYGIGDVGNIVLRDRKHLAEDGILVVVTTLSDSKIASGPDFISRGFVYVREAEALLDEANRHVTQKIKELLRENVNQWNTLKLAIKETLGRYLYEKTGRRPVILPILLEV
ncbi:ribonuclease J [Paenibacillus athensensis]|uniref:Ribonuclease J n=1 Tax=Paenibacillus athensensis TaxID=1967502 RepID=A0A4Y8PX71_9BACL|nr:ribonuclease J [Paenibacillus athensensis]